MWLMGSREYTKGFLVLHDERLSDIYLYSTGREILLRMSTPLSQEGFYSTKN